MFQKKISGREINDKADLMIFQWSTRRFLQTLRTGAIYLLTDEGGEKFQSFRGSPLPSSKRWWLSPPPLAHPQDFPRISMAQKLIFVFWVAQTWTWSLHIRKIPAPKRRGFEFECRRKVYSIVKIVLGSEVCFDACLGWKLKNKFGINKSSFDFQT